MIKKFNKDLQNEILEMKVLDHHVRSKFIEFKETNEENNIHFLELTHAIIQADKENNLKLKKILHQFGWPGYSLVGEDGSHDFWLLVQHQDVDTTFQNECLTFLHEAMMNKEASSEDLAFLTDRVRMNQGKAQVYGTQWVRGSNNKFHLYTVEDQEHLHERRRLMGLPLLEKSKRSMMDYMKLSEEDFE